MGILLIGIFFFSGFCRKAQSVDALIFKFVDRLEQENIRKSPFLDGTYNSLSESFFPVDSYSISERGTEACPLGLKRKIGLGGVEIKTLFSPPESEFVYDVMLPKDGILDFGIGVIQDSYSEALQKFDGREQKSVGFTILLEIKGKKKTVFQKFLELPPHRKERTMNFSQNKVRLPSQAQPAKIHLLTYGEEGIFAFWSHPLLYSGKRNGKNVILVSIDTLRADHLSSYGYRRKTSPYMDALAQDGVLFLEAYSASPWTLPSHVTMMTSLSGPQHQVSSGDERIDPSLTTLAEILGSRGYLCSAMTGGGFVSSIYGFSKGFDFYQDGEGAFSSPSAAEHLGESVSEWLEKNADKRFFLFLHTYQTHFPYNAPKPLGTMFLGENSLWEEFDFIKQFGFKEGIFKRLTEKERQNVIDLYDGEIRYTDEALIRPLKVKLEALGLYNQTLIVLVSDHGEEFFEHKSWGHGQDVYNECLRVPLIVKFPGSKFRGARIPQIVRLIDVLPTILETLGIETSGFDFEGQSLIPVIKGVHEDRAFLADTCWLGPSELQPPEESVLNPYIPQKVTMNAGKFKIILNRKLSQEVLDILTTPPPTIPAVELYDLDHDPEETRNCAAENPQLVRQLLQRIEDIYKKAKWRDIRRDRMSRDLEKQLRALGYIR
ncbi:MAG: sulfatase [Candidatus Aminicenantales bacterium]